MKRIRLDEIAREHMREIHAYSSKRWGELRADNYVRVLSAKFEDIAEGKAYSKSISAVFGVEGQFCRCAEHLIYWRNLDSDAIAIVAVLHQRMHQQDRVRNAFERSP